MLIPAWMIGREEGNVQRRDGAYPDFIRALGGTAQARSAEPSAPSKRCVVSISECWMLPSIGSSVDLRRD